MGEVSSKARDLGSDRGYRVAVIRVLRQDAVTGRSEPHPYNEANHDVANHYRYFFAVVFSGNENAYMVSPTGTIRYWRPASS
jgi:hypothetical protein